MEKLLEQKMELKHCKIPEITQKSSYVHLKFISAK